MLKSTNILRNITFICLCLFNVFIYAQEINDDFLNSLPGSVRSDVLNEMAAANEAIEKYYSPDTDVEKPEVVLKRLMQEMYSLEKRIAPKDDNDIQRFGSLIFKTIQSSFMPINEISANDGYILGPGDQVIAQFVGSMNSTNELFIRNDGSINIPNFGKYFIGGMSLDQANDYLSQQVNNKMIGTEFYITLNKARDIQVLIVGNVESPGMYTLNGFSSPLNALSVSGGITENGSFRKIEIKRNEKVIANIDLYDVFIFGNMPKNISLKSGDSIIVGSKEKEIIIYGGVARPAIYELKNNENLKNLIDFAGGLSQYSRLANDNNIKITKNSGSNLISLKLDDLSSYNDLMPGDRVYVPFFEPVNRSVNVVTIKGDVNKPGKYSIDEDTNLSELISIAGGYTDEAYPFGGVLIRKSFKDLEDYYNEKIYSNLLKFLLSSPNALGESSKGIEFLLSEVKEREPIGRFSTEFNLLKIKTNKKLDTVLENDDEIFIPKRTNKVMVLGEINNPGTVLFDSNKNAIDYINLSGGFNNFASKTVILISPNGEASKINMSKFSIGSYINNTSIYPGSLLYVPRDYERITGINLAATLSPIVSSVALSLASLNAINN